MKFKGFDAEMSIPSCHTKRNVNLKRVFSFVNKRNSTHYKNLRFSLRAKLFSIYINSIDFRDASTLKSNYYVCNNISMFLTFIFIVQKLLETYLQDEPKVLVPLEKVAIFFLLQIQNRSNFSI